MLLKKMAVRAIFAAVFSAGTLGLANVHSINIRVKNNSATKHANPINKKSRFSIPVKESTRHLNSKIERITVNYSYGENSSNHKSTNNFYICGEGSCSLPDSRIETTRDNHYFYNKYNISDFYIRGEGSYSLPDSKIETTKEHYYQQEFVDTSSFILSKSQGFSGRFALGYNLNAVLSIETGANFIHSIQKSVVLSVETGADSIHSIQKSVVRNRQHLSNIIFKTTLDLLGTITFRSQNNFYAFAKGGVAYIPTKTITITKFEEDGKDTMIESTYYMNYFRPKVAVGIGYNFSKHVSADISYSRIFGTQNKIDVDDHLPHLNFTTIAVNVSI